MNKLTPIIGAQLVSMVNPYPNFASTSSMEEVSLQFDTGHLAIHNPCTLQCDSGLAVEFSSVIGNRVTDAYAMSDELAIVFEGRIYLRISLKEEDFIRPEAAVYQPTSGPIILIRAGTTR
jgi:hypothetical protein